MRKAVTKKARREYINEIRQRYRAASKPEQTRLLDESVKITRWNRKYLIRVLNKKSGHCGCSVAGSAGPGAGEPTQKTRGRPRQYDAAGIVNFLITLWHASNQACGKRLKSILPLWLPWYTEKHNGKKLSLLDQVLLTRISAATIDRLLKVERSHYRTKGRCTTKPGTLQLRKCIPIKTDQWREKRPGFLEVDTVAHCGTSTAGMFVYTLNTVDIGSGWVEPRAVWGKGEIGVLKAFQSIEGVLPFPLRGFDSDNGGEFINHHIEKYLRGRKRSVEYTRCREYNKNDNAHIEQKNWTHVRQLFGYERFDNPAVLHLMNDLYTQEYSLLMNFFLPSVKLQAKERIGSKLIKRHDRPQTPCERLLKSRSIPEQTKSRLRKMQASLNPFLLRQAVQHKAKTILCHCSLSRPPIALTRSQPRHLSSTASHIKTRQSLLPPLAPPKQHLKNSLRSLTRRIKTTKDT